MTLVVIVATSVPPESVRIGPAPQAIQASSMVQDSPLPLGTSSINRWPRRALDFRCVDPPVLVQVEAHTEDGRGGFLNLELV